MKNILMLALVLSACRVEEKTEKKGLFNTPQNQNGQSSNSTGAPSVTEAMLPKIFATADKSGNGLDSGDRAALMETIKKLADELHACLATSATPETLCFKTSKFDDAGISKVKQMAQFAKNNTSGKITWAEPTVEGTFVVLTGAVNTKNVSKATTASLNFRMTEEGYPDFQTFEYEANLQIAPDEITPSSTSTATVTTTTTTSTATTTAATSSGTTNSAADFHAAWEGKTIASYLSSGVPFYCIEFSTKLGSCKAFSKLDYEGYGATKVYAARSGECFVTVGKTSLDVSCKTADGKSCKSSPSTYFEIDTIYPDGNFKAKDASFIWTLDDGAKKRWEVKSGSQCAAVMKASDN